MFESLAAEVDELSISPCGEALTEVLAIQDRLAAKISDAVGDFDRAGLWNLDSATSMIAWLRQHGAMTKREAGRVSDGPRSCVSFPSPLLRGGQVS